MALYGALDAHLSLSFVHRTHLITWVFTNGQSLLLMIAIFNVLFLSPTTPIPPIRPLCPQHAN